MFDRFFRFLRNSRAAKEGPFTALVNWLGEKAGLGCPDSVDVPRPPRDEGMNVGRKMDDGTIYIGMSPDTGAPLYILPADEAMPMTFQQAKDHAARIDGAGHEDWRLPTRGELEVLYKFHERAGLKDTFNKSSWQDAFYWSSTSCGANEAYAQQFMPGLGGSHQLKKDSRISVRVVRG